MYAALSSTLGGKVGYVCLMRFVLISFFPYHWKEVENGWENPVQQYSEYHLS